jgi:hypothetical protein
MDTDSGKRLSFGMQIEDPKRDCKQNIPLVEAFHEHCFYFSCILAESMCGSIHRLPNFLNANSSIGDYSH